MPRPLRIAPGGMVYHVLNRGVGGRALFRKVGDYKAFEGVLSEGCERMPSVALLSYCVMPDHWHLLVRPKGRGGLSQFMRWLTVTHTQRFHAQHGSAGDGPIYQGRFRSFAIQDAGYFLLAARYVEANALRAGRVDRAEDWRWSSLAARRSGESVVSDVLADWPVLEGASAGAGGVPRQWLRTVNAAMGEKELEAVRLCAQRGRPMGDERWVQRMAKRLGAESTLRPRGRPRKNVEF